MAISFKGAHFPKDVILLATRACWMYSVGLIQVALANRCMNVRFPRCAKNADSLSWCNHAFWGKFDALHSNWSRLDRVALVPRVILHVSADLGTAKDVEINLARRDVPTKRYAVTSDTAKDTDWTAIAALIVIVSTDSLNDPAVRACVDAADAQRLAIYPLRADGVEIAGPMDFYLKSIQWLDLASPEDAPAFYDRLAQMIQTRDPVVAAQSLTTARPSKPASKRGWVLAAAAVGLAACLGVGGTFALSWLRPPLEAPNSLFAYAQGDDGNPWIDPPGNTFNLGFSLSLRQPRAVTAAFYVPDGTGYRLLGETTQVPKAEYGRFNLKFPIAEDVATGVVCLVYDGAGRDDRPQRQVIVQALDDGAQTGPPLTLAKLDREDESCDAALDAPVDRRTNQPVLEKRAAMLAAYETYTFLNIRELNVSANAVTIGGLKLTDTYPQPDVIGTATIFGGATADDQSLLLHVDLADGTPKYEGPVPRHVTACVASAMGDWKMISLRQAKWLNSRAQIGPHRQDFVQGDAPCLMLFGGNHDLSGIAKRWPDAVQFLPPDTSGPGAQTNAVEILGLSLGNRFEDGVSRLKAEFPDTPPEIKTGRNVQFGMAHAATEHWALIWPRDIFPDARVAVVSSDRGMLAIYEKPGTDRIQAIVATKRPPLRQVDQKNPTYSSTQYYDEILAAFGPPTEQQSYGEGYASSRNGLIAKWAASQGADCEWEDRPASEIPKNPGPARHIRQVVRCPAMLEARYGRNGYTLATWLFLTEATP